MNKVHRSVWNEITRTFVAVAEVVRSNRKSSEQAEVLSASQINPILLEQRFMFDGALVSALVDPNLQTATDVHVDTTQSDLSKAIAVAEVSAQPPQVVRTVDPALNNGRKEVAFVDTGVADYQTLVDGIRTGVEVVLLDAGQDGLAQMALWAQSHSGYDAIHVISHGAQGTIFLGSRELNQATLSNGQVDIELHTIGESLNAGGDLLLYGCSISEGGSGQTFVTTLAQLTSSDVAASTDATGASGLGGDWVLETDIGAITTASVIDPTAVSKFNTLLAVPADQNFESSTTAGNLTNNITIGGVTYSTNGTGSPDVFDYVSFYLDPNPHLTGNVLVSDINSSADGTMTYVQFSTADGSNFKLNSLAANAWTTAAAFSQVFTITGYDGGSTSPVVVSVTGFDFQHSGTYGIGNAAITYTKDPDLNGYGYGVGLLTFGSAWDRIDTVRFTETDGLSAMLALDSLDFSPPTAALGPTVTDARISITTSPSGSSGTYKIGDTVTASWNNSATGDNQSGVTSVTFDFSQFGGGSAIAATNSSGTWTASYTITSGTADATSRNVSVTATNGSGTTTTADSSNLSVDNIAPTITDARISISGGTGTGGAYKIGDTLTATWNNTALGDNNSDTISSVTADFSQFGGGSAVTATNSSGTWSASYTITAGAIDATSRNVSFSATDNAGNTTTTADTTNATVDNIAPTVTDGRISISGASGTGGAFKTGDTVTATWNNTSGGDNNTDTISGATVNFSQFGGGSAVAASNSSGTWTATYTIVSGSVDTTSRNVSISATDNAGNTTNTADTTNATVDNIAPTVTDAKISISGGTGAGGAFKIGDTVTATWNNTAGGDNNTDTISAVTMDFSQFGGGSAVSASNASGTWTATYNIVAGALNRSTNRNISVTATDNAGNVTTTADTTNAIVDNVVPVIASVSIPNTTMKVGDVVTATITVSTDSDTYSLSSGSVGGFALGSLTKISGTSYSATFTVTEGGTDVAAGSSIPVSLVLSDAAGNLSTTYSTAVAQTADAINAHTPSAIALSSNTLSNTAGSNTPVGTLSSTDATVGDSFTYSLVSGAGSTDNASFSISGSSLVATNPSALTAGSYSVRVRTTDVAGNNFEQAFSITVTSNQAPSVTTPTAITLVDTSATDTFGNQTGTLAATDTDGVASYGIQGGTTGGADSIGGVTYDVSKAGTYGTLYVKSSDGSYVFVPNATAINARKTSTSETFTVTATDNNVSPATGTTTLSVNITGANDAPTDLALSAATVNQSAGANATVGALSSTDVDTGETFTYTLVSGAGDTNNGSFNISGGNLRATNPANLAAGTYSVRVRTTDASSSTYEEALSITVVDDVVPTVSSVSVPSNAWYTAGQNLDFTVNLSEVVIVDTTGGTPRIALTVGSTTVYATYVSGSGTNALVFSYTVQANELDTDGITVGTLGLNGGTIQDAAGNNATLTLNSVGSTTAVKVDAVNPSAPSAPDLNTVSDTGASTTDNITNDNTPTLSGTAEANSTVAIYDGTTLLGTATADGTGSWSYTATTLSNGSHTLTTKATDAAGNVSSASAGLTITVDAAAPTAVSLSQTSVAETAATSGSTVATLSATDTNTVTYALVSGSGDTNNTSFNIVSGNLQAASNLSAGTYQILVRATDAAGNTTDQALTITVTSGPSVASINRAGPTALTNASSVDYTVTFSESVTQVDLTDFMLTSTGSATGTISAVSGTGSTYTVTVNGLSGDGTLRLDLKNSGTGILNGGSQAITAGYTSGQTYTLDTTAPSAPSGLDLLASSDSGSSNTDNNTSDNTPTISGAGAEPNCTVTLYDTDGTTVLGTTTADGAGNWTITSSTLIDGTHTLTTKVTDAAGNTSNASAGLTATIDSTAPSAPLAPDLVSSSDTGSSNSDNATSNTTPTFSGTAEANSTVTLYDTDGTTVLGTATADGSGNWSITSSTLSEGSHTLTVKAIDAAGNTGAASAGILVSVDTIAPNAPSTPDLASGSRASNTTDNTTNTTTPTITGTAEPGCTVTLYDTNGTTVLGTVTADGSGNWSITSITLTLGVHTLTTKSTDAAGNTSASSAALSVTVASQQVLTAQTPSNTFLPSSPSSRPPVASPEMNVRSTAASFFSQPKIGEITGITIDSLVNSLTPVTNEKVIETAPRAVSVGVRSGSGEIFASGLSAINKLAEMEIPQGEVSTISLPAGTFVHTDATARVSLSARLSDGKPLPSYVKFNPTTGTFTVEASNRPPVDLQIRVIAVDDKGKTANTTVVIKIKGKSKSTSSIDVLPVSGKMAFTEQLRNSEKPSELMSHLAALNKAFEASNASRSHS